MLYLLVVVALVVAAAAELAKEEMTMQPFLQPKN